MDPNDYCERGTAMNLKVRLDELFPFGQGGRSHLVGCELVAFGDAAVGFCRRYVALRCSRAFEFPHRMIAAYSLDGL
jgi:hypothetical protein